MPSRASFWDRALAAVGLERANRRSGPRAVYAGATYSRLTEDWFTAILSADQEIKADLRRLRGAARSLVRDNSFAERYVAMLAENVIGPHGIRLQARAGTTRGGLNTRLNAQIEAAWEEWSRPENADVGGRLSWVDLQALVLRGIALDGEALVREVRGADNPFNYALQLLDPDQLDETYNVGYGLGPNGNEVRMGVEMDRFQKPVAYHLWAEHPSDPRGRQHRERVPVAELMHLFVVKRPGQTRGVTWFAPVMFDQKMLQAYQEAEITAARIGASNMAAVTYDPDKGVAPDPNLVGDGGIPMEVDPGRFLRLAPGENLVATQFDHPSTAFAPFTTAIQRSIAAGLGVAYTSLSGDLAAVNYSSIRAGLLSERDFYRRLQVWLPAVFHQRVYRSWAPLAALAGWFPASEARGAERVLWQPRGWKWVDPKNDIEAAVLARQHGLATYTQLCGETGADFEENLEQIAEEDRLARDLGVTLGGPLPLPDTQKTTDQNETTPNGDGADRTGAPSGASPRPRMEVA